MTYPEALKFLYSLELFGVKLGLDNITKFLNRLGNPQNSFQGIHVAGTNGKGSVASIFESILVEAGFKVGKFTSPHLYNFRERFHINKRKVNEEFVTDFINSHKDYIKKSRTTFFETCTGLAFELFRQQKVDWAVVEVGLGGRLDATSLIKPDLTVITRIAIDHVKTLGNTLAKIAFEKCGIIKKGVPLVTSSSNPEALDVIRNVVDEREAPLYHVDSKRNVEMVQLDIHSMDFKFCPNSAPGKIFTSNLIGHHQAENCALVLKGMDILVEKGLKIDDDAIRAGLQNIFWPARLQYVEGKPGLILDCAHNPSGIQAFVRNIEKIFPGREFILLLGLLRRPDYPGIFSEIKKIAKMTILTIPDRDRAPVPEALAREAIGARLNFKMIPPALEAFTYARKLVPSDDILLVVGSHFTLGEIMKSEKIPT
jgi:dihydrofolate synthase / folylpolyglutamate synthase